MQLHQGFLLVGQANRTVPNQGLEGSRNPQPLQVESEKGFVAGVEPALRDQGRDSEFWSMFSGGDLLAFGCLSWGIRIGRCTIGHQPS